MPMLEILEVTDGTDTVSFLNEGSGFVLNEWEPKIAQPKDGGIYKDSGIADGRKLAMIRYANVEEEFLLTITGENPNSLTRNLRKLRALLIKANTYWLSGFAYEPVWLQVKGKDEAYIRYSIITGWRMEKESNPFHPPVSGGNLVLSAMNDFEIMIEREPFWLDTVPGSDVQIESGVTYDYDGRTLGNVDDAGVAEPTIAAESFFTNKHLFTNLTDIYEQDGAAWSANLLDAALPYRLLPAVPVVDDAIYFGIRTGSASPGPFSSLIFDNATAAVGVTGVWEYYTGAAFAAFPAFYMADNIQGFSQTGVLGAFWDTPVDFTTGNLLAILGGAAPNVTAWWVRFRVTVAAGASGASQRNRNIYSCTWPYAEIQNDQIDGEIPALVRMKIRNESNYDDDADYQKYIDWLICGARGADRGEDFSAYIPLSDIQLLSGESIDLSANAVYIDDVLNSGRGRVINCIAAAFSSSWIFVTLDNTIANQYKGRFRLYMRYRDGGNNGDWELQIQSRSFGNTWMSEKIGCPSSIEPAVIDFGTIDLPPAGFGKNETVEQIVFWLKFDHVVGAVDLEIQELVLLPVDEWIGAFYGTTISIGQYGPNLWGTNYLDIDSITYPKQMIYSPVRLRASDYLQSQWTSNSVAPFQLENNRKVRMWYLTQRPQVINLDRYSNHVYSHNVQFSIVRRYLSAIGGSL